MRLALYRYTFIYVCLFVYNYYIFNMADYYLKVPL